MQMSYKLQSEDAWVCFWMRVEAFFLKLFQTIYGDVGDIRL